MLVEIAFDSYLNYYFFDNVVNYLNAKNEQEPLKIIEYLLENEGVNHFIYDDIYKNIHMEGNSERIALSDENLNTILQVNRDNRPNSGNNTILTILTNEQWSCCSCTYLNEPETPTCVMCHTAKNLPNATFL